VAARFRRWRLSVEGFDLPGVARRRGRRHDAPNRGDLDIASLNEPAGTYTLYVLVQDPENWKLIINNQTGQNEDSYDPSVDLGRVDMEMEKPPGARRKPEVYDHHQGRHRQTSTGMGEPHRLGFVSGELG